MKDKTKGSVIDLKKAFLEINDLKMEKIDLSEFNFPGEIFAKTLSMQTCQDITEECTVLKKGVEIADAKPSDYEFSDDFVGKTIAASVCDSEGNTIFDEEDIPAVMKKSKTIFQKIQTVVQRMNENITPEEVDAKAKK